MPLSNMSLKFFFNRSGWVVLGLTGLGWALGVCQVARLLVNDVIWPQKTAIIYGLFMAQCLLITVIRFWPWYPRADRGHGIEEHFQKNLVPVAYLMVLVNMVPFVWQDPSPLFILLALCLLPFHYVNFILIYFHLIDKTPEPPAFLSRTNNDSNEMAL